MHPVSFLRCRATGAEGGPSYEAEPVDEAEPPVVVVVLDPEPELAPEPEALDRTETAPGKCVST